MTANSYRYRVQAKYPSAPLAYWIDGKQWVELVAGHASLPGQAGGALVLEVVNPPDNGGAICVFALSD